MRKLLRKEGNMIGEVLDLMAESGAVLAGSPRMVTISSSVRFS
jgi:hypothetical protein